MKLNLQMTNQLRRVGKILVKSVTTTNRKRNVNLTKKILVSLKRLGLLSSMARLRQGKRWKLGYPE